MDTRASSRFRSATVLIAALSVLLAACGSDPGLTVSDDVGSPSQAVAAGAEEPGDADAEVPDEDPTQAPAEDGTAADEAPAEEAPDDADGPAEADAGTGTPDDDLDCSAQGGDVEVRPVDGMPAEVVAARDFLLDAALRCDEQLLFTAIEESDLFTYSFGSTDDPIGYWWELEEAGEEPFLRLAQVLATTPSTLEDGALWVWPQVHTGLTEDSTDAAWAELTWLEDPRTTRAAEDGYLDWRVGITADGQWRFFVRGD